ncbi:MAG: hypothetical protein GF409_06740 [Candidatus Omnitrophica bacterium]|nr:hypothetical protein [Candidatus Omnitrophota bacterium]
MMMRKNLETLLAAVLLVVFSPCASGAVSGDVPERIPVEAKAEQEDVDRRAGEVAPDKERRASPRDRRIRRDLEREYRAGGLTKTEYIQRLRELGEIEK